MKDSLRITALSVSGLVALAVTGCGAPSPEQAPPPPMSASEPAPPAADLLGGPPTQPPAPASGHAGSVAPQAPATMQPIPNPEDMTPQQRHQIYGDRYATATASAPWGAPADHVRRHHRRSVAALSRGIAAAHAPSANPAANYGAPASAATLIASPQHRPVHGQPGAGLSSAASDSLPATVASSASASAPAASAAPASEHGAPANITAIARPSAPAKPRGKVIAASIAVLIALVVLIATARNSVIGRPRPATC